MPPSRFISSGSDISLCNLDTTLPGSNFPSCFISLILFIPESGYVVIDFHFGGETFIFSYAYSKRMESFYGKNN